MKKVLALVLAALMLLCVVSCGKKDDPSKKSEGVMTYAEFAAAAVDSKVTIETYVQAKQSWWDNKGTIYTQDADGGYFLYEMAMSQEDYDKLVPGTKIKVTGTKAEWSGEVEITDATFEIENGSYIPKAIDVTALFGTDDLAKKMNMFVAVKGATVAAKKNADGADVAFLYKWDGSGQQGDDIYFDVEIGGKTYSFTVESYLCGKDTDVYKAVEALKVGDKIDIEGFLYWYEGPQPHVTSVAAAK
ncbi:MAG: hypothetical protein MJ192_07775 [Clostridia bacterium]|nr:hypothetical protein [Clostridia bacterium]